MPTWEVDSTHYAAPKTVEADFIRSDELFVDFVLHGGPTGQIIKLRLPTGSIRSIELKD